MPAPYSDNLYSGDDNPWNNDQNDADADALSPADGYFHASSSGLEEAATSSPSPPVRQQRQSANVPFVPNVMVEDPTLNEDRAAAKAKEAAEERLINSASAGRSTPLTDSQPHHQTVPFAQGQAGFYSPSHPSQSTPVAPYPRLDTHYQSTPASASSSSPSSSGHHHRRSIDEEISSFQPTSPASQTPRQYTVRRPSDAPPAYSPSASSPLSSGYQTFAPPQADIEAMGVPEENQTLLPRQPESMGGASNGAREPLWRRIRNSTNSSTTRKRIRTILGILVIISIIVALFGSTINISSPKKPGIIDESPVKAPPTNNPPPMSWPPRNSRNCLGEPHKSAKINEVISFGNNKKLSIVQTLEKDNGNHRGVTPNVYGEVILQPVDPSSTGDIQLEITTNYQGLHVDVEFNKRDQRFEVVIPRWVTWSSPSSWQPCIQVRITVSIPREAALESILVDAIHLDVAVRDGLVLSSATDAQIKTVAGDVTTGRVSGEVAPYTLASRSIIVETVSGDVTGWFPLYDLLKVHTVSGDIKTDITPKPSSDKKPEQAVLNIDSVSGHIKLTEPLGYDSDKKREERFPPRDYAVSVSSASGEIKADLAFTSTAKFETVSGDQKIRLQPIFGSSSSPPSISTDTKSGQTQLTVFEPLWKHSAASIGGHSDPLEPPARDDDEPKNDEPWIIIHPDERLTRLPPPPYMDVKPSMAAAAANGGGDEQPHGLTDLKSHHASVSGDFKLIYPASWEGKFSMTTFSGSQDIRGKDIKYTRAGGIIKRIDGTKGDGRSSLTVDSMSGREELVIGSV
ncbi:hypothetical protein Trisim1_004840 [Trichoderma cf. simile WF8]